MTQLVSRLWQHSREDLNGVNDKAVSEPELMSARPDSPAEDLHGAASRDGLPRILAFFNKTHELWVGRVAMIGIVGLAVLEAVRGTPLF